MKKRKLLRGHLSLKNHLRRRVPLEVKVKLKGIVRLRDQN